MKLVYLLLLLLLAFACKQGPSSLVVYPSPGDLSQVEGLEESPVFDILVNGQDAFVYRALENEPQKHSKRGVSYVNFAFAKGEPIHAHIQTTDSIISWEILPKFCGKSSNISPQELRLDFTEHGKYVLIAQLSNLGEQYFIISAEAPEVVIPSPTADGVLYLKQGVHKYGQSWDPFANGIHTLYLEGGAVLEATIKTKHHNNISILGRGLISQAFVPHAKEATALERGWSANWMGTFIQYCNNVHIEGIAITCSPSFQLEVAGCNGVNIENVKLCGFGESNNDGMHLYSKDVKVNDCLIAANDDRICITGLFDDDETPVPENGDISVRMTDYPVENMHINNVVFWGLWNGGDIMLTWNASSECKNVVIENCKSIWPTNKAFLSAKDGGSALIHNIEIRNCLLYHGNLVDVRVIGADCWGKGGGNIRDITVRDIQLNVNPSQVKKQIIGMSENSTAKNFKFINISANDSLIHHLSQTDIFLNEYVSGIDFIIE